MNKEGERAAEKTSTTATQIDLPVKKIQVIRVGIMCRVLRILKTFHFIKEE